MTNDEELLIRLKRKMINSVAKCKICNNGYNLIIDNIIPIADGGIDTKNNWQVLCKICSNKKLWSYPQV